MRPLLPKLTVLGCAVLVTAGLAACGGGSSAATSASASSASPATAQGSASTAPAQGSASEAASLVAASSAAVPAAATGSPFCRVVSRQQALLKGTELSGLLAGGTPAAWKAYLAKASALNAELVAAAPPELAASLRVLASAEAELAGTMAAAGYDVTKVGAAKLIKTMQSKPRVEATATLVSYVRTTCKIDLTS